MLSTWSRPRILLRAALRAYWPYLFGPLIPLAPTFLWPDFRLHPVLVFTSMLTGTVLTAWPWLRLDAPYSFCAVAFLAWFGLPVALAFFVLAASHIATFIFQR